MLIGPKAREDTHRVWDAAVLFVQKLVLTGVLGATDWVLKYLVTHVLDDELGRTVVNLIVDVGFLGVAVLVALSGAIVVAVEVLRATVDYVEGGPSGQDKREP